jgi:sortase A
MVASVVTNGEGRRSRVLRSGAKVLGTTLIVAGILLVVWVVVVWRWSDPFTALYTRYQQQGLQQEYRQQARALQPLVPVAGRSEREPLALVLVEIARQAASYRRELETGDPVGVLKVPRMGLHVVVVNGTDHETLKRGPGRDERTYIPGQSELVYVAGHRTTYGAPFASINELRPGDSARFEVPYARFTYEFTGHRIVAADRLEVLRSRGREQLSLQACHPRFFATQRYIADARLVEVAVRDGRGGWQTYRVASDK